MYSRIEAEQLKDIFLRMGERKKQGVYFMRLATWSDEIRKTVWDIHQKAAMNGVVLEEKIVNPDERQISYLNETLGDAFRPDHDFLMQALSKWMPRMSENCRKEFSDALCKIFNEQKQIGKPDSVLKNIYVKMMCWLFYKFERIMPQLGNADLPVVLYEGASITNHELMFLRILSFMGTDILLLEKNGDAPYLKLDAISQWSQMMCKGQGSAFPQEFTLKSLRKEMRNQPETIRTQPPNGATARQQPVAQRPASAPAPVQRPAQPVSTSARPAQIPPQVASQQTSSGRPIGGNSHIQYTRNIGQNVPQSNPKQQTDMPASVPGPQTRHINVGRPYDSNQAAGQAATGNGMPRQSSLEGRFQKPKKTPCTNAWMEKPEYDQILTPIAARGVDESLFYNALIRVSGVPDRTTYVNELYIFYQKLVKTGRNILVIDGEIPAPSPEELRKVRRRNYNAVDELIVDLAMNIPAGAQVELQRHMQRSFVQAITEAAKSEPNLNRLTVTAVYLLSWMMRYHAALYSGKRDGDVPVFILMGGCHTERECFFVQFLASLPVDVLLLAPDLNHPCKFNSSVLLDLPYNNSLALEVFPRENTNLHMRTVASSAEGDLDTILYDGTGMYRDKQFSHATALVLHTTFDEIFILWDQELRYRPSFNSDDRHVNMPVIFSKVSGVEHSDMLSYWQKVKQLMGNDTFFVSQFPILQPGIGNQFQTLAQRGLRNNKLLREVIKNDRQYPFSLLRGELQEHILDKLQMMLDHKIIKGTFSNGTEYTILATVFNMKKELLRMIQAFDFTKKNPKILCTSTRDSMPSLEDAIMLTFLSLVGFDVALFIPTGYQTIEKYLNDYLPVEHQIGDYIYDQSIPDFSTLPPPKNRGWLNNIFRR